MKRHTETAKWRNEWFRELEPAHKLVWLYLLDDCDDAGVFRLDAKRMEFEIGTDCDFAGFLAQAGNRIVPLDEPRKYWIVDFITFQFPGGVSESAKRHGALRDSVEKHGLAKRLGIDWSIFGQSLPIPEGIVISFDEFDESPPPPAKARAKKPKAGWEPDANQKRINALRQFRRRDTTPWSEKECRQYAALAKAGMMDEESLSMVEAYYAANLPNDMMDIRRTTVEILLNNWGGEVDRARNALTVLGKAKSFSGPTEGEKRRARIKELQGMLISQEQRLRESDHPIVASSARKRIEELSQEIDHLELFRS